MRAFIVRPFGVKEGFDFERIHQELILPAMSVAELDGGTTGEVFLAGDIREDMFSSLLLDDFVIADITIHNANVFYELGIRHALREKRTILIKCPGFAETPFDILGYKYVSYTKDNPGGAVPDLARFISEMLATEDRTDSPVYKVLPQLKSQDPEKYLAVPQAFDARLKVAAAAKDFKTIREMTTEAEDASWKRPAYRLIGEVLFAANEFRGAVTLWEDVLATLPLDRQANDRLSTIYQRLARDVLKTNPDKANALLAQSDIAVKILLDNPELTDFQRAETFSLSARNAKTRWLMTFEYLTTIEQRQKAALQSSDLELSCRLYEEGFRADINHYYSGINVLAMVVIQLTLARNNPQTWELGFSTPEDAAAMLTNLNSLYSKYLPAVRLSIEIARKKAVMSNKPNIYADISEADFMCLTSSNPEQVKFYYTRALTGASEQNKNSVRNQLKLYETLGVQEANVAAALSGIE